MSYLVLLPKGNIFCWFLLVLIFALVVRWILCHFKTIAVRQGEADYKEEFTNAIKIFKNDSYWDIFWQVFFSKKGDLHIDDYWLPTIIGISEMVAFPVLMEYHKWNFIGYWLGIKTASHWGLWQKSRTAYNRFLFGNILSLFFSYALFQLFYLKGPVALNSISFNLAGIPNFGIDKIFNKINDYSNLMLVLVTLGYAFLTYFILKENRRDRLNQKMPVVVFRFRLDQGKAQERMVNIGSGPALDIQLETNLILNGDTVTGFNRNQLTALPPTLPVDNVLGPDNGDPDMQICFMISPNGVSVLKNREAIFKVTYKDVFGRKHETIFQDCKNNFKSPRGNLFV